MKLSERIYNYLSRRPEQWFHRFELEKKARAKGYSTFHIKKVFDKLGDPTRFPDVCSLYFSKSDRYKPVEGYGEHWRVIPMTEKEKETHISAHKAFDALP